MPEEYSLEITLSDIMGLITEKCLEGLSDRERRFAHHRSFDTLCCGENKTYDEIAAIEGVCKERCRQICFRAARIIRKNLLGIKTRIEGPYVIVKTVLPESKEKGSSLDDIFIEDFAQLSCRTRNCLRQMAIYTFENLTQLTEVEMIKTPNFGRKSLNEIIAMMKLAGIEFSKTAEWDDLRRFLSQEEIDKRHEKYTKKLKG